MEAVLVLILLGWAWDRIRPPSKAELAKRKAWKEKVAENPNILDVLM